MSDKKPTELNDRDLADANGGYYKITFSDILISSYQSSGSAGGDSQDTQKVLLGDGSVRQPS